MSNLAYPKFGTHLCQGEIDFRTAVIKVAVMDTDYTYDDTDEFLSDLPTPVATTTLSLSSYLLGVIGFNNTPIEIEGMLSSLVIYVDTGSLSTSPLFLHFDDGILIGQNQDGDRLIIWPTVPGQLVYAILGRVV